MVHRWNHKLHGLRWPTLFDAADQALPALALDARVISEQLIRGERGVLDRAQLLTALTPHGLSPLEVRENTVKFAVPALPPGLPALPAGYGYKGGAARSALGALLARDSFPPRDLDVVRFGRGWTALDEEVSRSCMARDFERGMGVEVCSSLGAYLGTRDLSCNELVLFDGELLVSAVGLFDTLGFVLRPCKYRGGSSRRPPRLDGRTAAKMLRLRAEGIACGGAWHVAGVPISQTLADFDIAIHLSRAIERGAEVAEAFLAQLRAVGIGDETLTLREAVEEFAPLLSSDSPLAEFERSLREKR